MCDVRKSAVSRMYLLKMMTLELSAIQVEMYTAGWKEADSGSERFCMAGLTVGNTGWAGSRAASSDARIFSSDMVAACGAWAAMHSRGCCRGGVRGGRRTESEVVASSGRHRWSLVGAGS